MGGGLYLLTTWRHPGSEGRGLFSYPALYVIRVVF